MTSTPIKWTPTPNPLAGVHAELTILNDKFDSIVQRLNYFIALVEPETDYEEERSDDETQPFDECDLEENNNGVSDTRKNNNLRRAFKSPRQKNASPSTHPN